MQKANSVSLFKLNKSYRPEKLVGFNPRNIMDVKGSTLASPYSFWRVTSNILRYGRKSVVTIMK